MAFGKPGTGKQKVQHVEKITQIEQHQLVGKEEKPPVVSTDSHKHWVEQDEQVML